MTPSRSSLVRGSSRCNLPASFLSSYFKHFFERSQDLATTVDRISVLCCCYPAHCPDNVLRNTTHAVCPGFDSSKLLSCHCDLHVLSIHADISSPFDVGDCAIASSFVSYLGPFNKEFRELLITRDFYGGCVKLNIPVTKDMQVTKFLVDDSEVGEWTLQVHNSVMQLHKTSCLLLAPGNLHRLIGKLDIPDSSTCCSTQAVLHLVAWRYALVFARLGLQGSSSLVE